LRKDSSFSILNSSILNSKVAAGALARKRQQE
jgi:hypothetical protein